MLNYIKFIMTSYFADSLIFFSFFFLFLAHYSGSELDFYKIICKLSARKGYAFSY